MTECCDRVVCDDDDDSQNEGVSYALHSCHRNHNRYDGRERRRSEGENGRGEEGRRGEGEKGRGGEGLCVMTMMNSNTKGFLMPSILAIETVIGIHEESEGGEKEKGEKERGGKEGYGRGKGDSR